MNHSWLNVIRRANIASHVGRRIKLSRMEKFEDWNGRFESLGTKLSFTWKIWGWNWLFHMFVRSPLNFLSSSATASYVRMVVALVNMKQSSSRPPYSPFPSIVALWSKTKNERGSYITYTYPWISQTRWHGGRSGSCASSSLPAYSSSSSSSSLPTCVSVVSRLGSDSWYGWPSSAATRWPSTP